MNFLKRCLAGALIATAGLLASGCDLDSDNDRDHVPPDGFGALLVDNNTSRDLRVYVDGDERGQVGDYSDRPFDLEPGVYRIVLDQRDSDASWRDEVDIIEGRLTVLDVADDFGDELDVRVFFD
jgi:hypothetical protein